MSLLTDVEFMLRRGSESRLKVDIALRQFKKSIRANGDAATYAGLDDRVKYNLCCSRLLQRDFSSWDGWEYRDDWSAAMRYGIKNIPFWKGENVERLVVIAEQGVGDEVLFASVLPEAMARCKQVTYCCDSRLVMPLARSLPGLHTMTRQVNALDDLAAGYDAYIPAGDLMALFRFRASHFPRRPFLKPDPSRVEEFEQYRGRVGISWAGRHGSIDPLSLDIDAPLSLQYDSAHEAIETPELDLRNDLEGVIALCSVLSKIVTVPTSVWHFAAAVGAPTEVILADKGTEADGVVDELDWHCQIGSSPYYGDSVTFKSVKDWRER